MKKIKQGLILSLILLAGCASTELKKESAKTTNLTDAQIKMLVIGKTMHLKGSGAGWTSVANADGTILGSSGSETDLGTYTIKNGKYCSKWNKWRDGITACWNIRKRASDYYLKLVSGPSNSYGFIVK